MKVADNVIVPTYRLRMVLPELGRVYTQYKDTEITKQQIADAMKFESTSGSFNQKLSDLKNYGLLKGGRDCFYITEFGLQVYSTHNIGLLEHARLNVPFWEYLSLKYNTQPTKENILAELVSLIGNEKNAKEKLEWIFFAYSDDLKYSLNGPITEIPLLKTEESSDTQKETALSVSEQTDSIVIQSKVTKSTGPDELKGSTNQTQKSDKPLENSTQSPDNQNGGNILHGVIEYRDYKFEIKDALSYTFAEQIMKTIKKELEVEGIKFDI